MAALYRNSSGETITLSEAQVNLSINNVQIGIESSWDTFTGPMGNSNITIGTVVTCAEHWFGRRCNIWCQDPSCECDQPVPCHNDCVGVVCGENRHCVDGVDQYVCTCDRGFVGRACDVNVNECVGVNCSENGRCMDQVNSFKCECNPGYTGVLCEIDYSDTQREGNTILSKCNQEIHIQSNIQYFSCSLY